MPTETLPLESIIVNDRFRKDYGDLDELCASLLRWGLLQPLGVDPENRLIWGGRRIAAHYILVQQGHEQFKTVKVERRSELTEDDRREMELEENLRRKDMTWQEMSLGLLEIHQIKARHAALNSQPWRNLDTGIAVGLSRQRIDQVLPVAREIAANPEGEVAKQPNFDAALRKLLELRQREAEKLIVAKSLGGSLQLTPDARGSIGLMPYPAQNSLPKSFGLEPSSDQTASGNGAEKTKLDINLAEFYSNVDCLQWMKANPASVDHIITDPPYAIDMAMLQQENTGMDVSKTVDEHAVAQNLTLLHSFIPAAFTVLKDKGFCVLFCDPIVFPVLVQMGEQAGFAVQRWPVVWCKPNAMNQAAGFNFTKATEFAVVMRKQGATLIDHQPLNWRCIARGANDKDFDHPFAKPFELWSWMVDAVSTPGQVIYDPFTGSGSGVCAFIKKGRQWRANEIAPQHHLEFLRNVAKCYQDHFTGQGVELNIHYTP